MIIPDVVVKVVVFKGKAAAAEIEAAVTRQYLPYMKHLDSCNKYATVYGLDEGTDRVRFDNHRKCTCGLDAIRAKYKEGQ